MPPDTADVDEDEDVSERVALDCGGVYRFLNDHTVADTGVVDPPLYTQVVDMGAYESGVVVYVDGSASGDDNGLSWEDAYRYLTDALGAVAYGGEIRVAAGTYTVGQSTSTPGGTSDRSVSFVLPIRWGSMAVFRLAGGFGAVVMDRRMRRF